MLALWRDVNGGGSVRPVLPYTQFSLSLLWMSWQSHTQPLNRIDDTTLSSRFYFLDQ